MTITEGDIITNNEFFIKAAVMNRDTEAIVDLVSCAIVSIFNKMEKADRDYGYTGISRFCSTDAFYSKANVLLTASYGCTLLSTLSMLERRILNAFNLWVDLSVREWETTENGVKSALRPKHLTVHDYYVFLNASSANAHSDTFTDLREIYNDYADHGGKLLDAANDAIDLNIIKDLKKLLPQRFTANENIQ